MRFVIRRIANAMVGRLGLPYPAQSQFTPRRSRVPTLDVLYGLLQRDLLFGSNDEMEMIRHDHELVKFESSLGAIRVKCANEELSGVRVFEKWVPPVGYGRDKERADFLRSMSHVSLKTTTSAKALNSTRHAYPGHKGRGFHPKNFPKSEAP